VGKTLERFWKANTRILACLLVISLLAGMMPAELLPVRRAAADPVDNRDLNLTEWSAVADPDGGFGDVSPEDWFYNAAIYVGENGIFNGTGDGAFSPRGTMTRAMFLTALGRMAGVDPGDYPVSSYSDVPADAWYAPYVEWAARQGITTGTGSGQFAPNATVTREQMVTMMLRFFESYDIPYDTGNGTDSVPADLDKVSPWAVQAVTKLWQAGLFQGDSNGNFNPQSEATRAEAAAVFMRSDAVVQTWQESQGSQGEEPGSGQDDTEGDNGGDNGGSTEGNGPGGNSNGGGNAGGGGNGGGNPTARFTVVFESNGGTAVANQTVAEGNKASAPPAPAKSGYVFGGWYKDSALTAPFDFTLDTVTGNMTLYAKWTEVTKNRYKVKFVTNGGTAVADQTVQEGAVAVIPSAPTRTGYTFAGWYSDSSLTTRYGFTEAVAADITLHAKWTINSYTVVFNSNGGSAVSSQTVNHGSPVSEPPAPTRTSHTFDGWYKDSAFTQSYDFSSAVTGDMTLYAKWTINRVSVRFYDSDGVTQLTSRTVDEGSRLTNLPAPVKNGYLFLGWYKDKDLTLAFAEGSKINSNTKLYAKYIELEDPSNTVMSVPVYSVLDVPADFTIEVSDTSGELTAGQVKAGMTFKDIADPDFVGIEVTAEGDHFVVASADKDQLFSEGNTYELKLVDDNLVFVDQDPTTRTYVFSVAKQEVLKLTFNPDIIFLPFEEVEDMEIDGEDVDSPSIPVMSVVTGGSGISLAEADGLSGTFIYDGSIPIQIGNVAAIYTGVRPDERTLANDELDAGDVAYVQITGKTGTKYTFGRADIKQVLFTPDILPIDKDDIVEEDADARTFKINLADLDYSDPVFGHYGLSETTTVDVGDFVGFYDGDFAREGSTVYGFGRIESLESEAEWLVITYTEVGIDEVEDALKDVFNIYRTYVIDGQMLLSQEDADLLEGQIAQQAKASGFADEAAKYLTGLVMETETFKSYGVSSLSASKVRVENLTVVPRVGGTQKLGKSGVGVTLQVSFDLVIPLEDNQSVLIHLTSTFLEEIGIEHDLDGDLLDHTHYVDTIFGEVPYWYCIDDYVVSARVDAFTYTYIDVHAEISTVEAGDLADVLLNYADAVTMGKAGQVLSIANELQALIDGVEDTEIDSEKLRERYREMLENETEWVTILKKQLFEASFKVLGGIIEVQLSADFVISANMNLTVGVQFDYRTARRYSATIYLWGSRDSRTDSVSLPGDEDYSFKFYVLGTLGLRAGVQLELKAGLFSVDINSIGMAAEPGAYVQLWGYFYYEVERASGQKQTRSSGVLFLEFGMYAEVKLGAALLDFSAELPLFEDTWPLLTAGDENSVLDFAYAQDEAGAFNMTGSVQSVPIPGSLLTMLEFNVKSGEETKVWFDKGWFDIQVDDPNFRINRNTLAVEVVDPSVPVSEGNLVITWIGTPLVFSSEPIQRTIPILWLARQGDYVLQLHPQNGGMTAVHALAYRAPVSVTEPVRAGYTFAGWYTEPDGGEEVTVPDTMPAEDLTLYAHWTANPDTPYTVQHYLVDPNRRDASVLDHTETRYGTTDTEIRFTSTKYENDDYGPASVSGISIKGDGSTVVKLEYYPASFTMTFDWGYAGAPRSSITEPFGKNIASRIPTPTRSGYTFAGWSPEVPGTMPKDDVTYTAQWTANEDTPYQVVYLQQNIGGSTYTAVDKEWHRGKSGDPVDLTNETPRDYAGFTFDPASSRLTANIAGDGSTELKLYYKRNTYKLIVHYNVPGMTDVDRDTPYGASLQQYLGTPERTGYTFTGWSNTPPTVMPDEDVEITAQWQLNEYTVTFDTNDGGEVPEQSVGYDGKVQEPAPPTKNGYAFGGWYTDSNLQTKYNFNTPVTRDLVLYAKWLNRYTVTFMSEGSSLSVQTVTEGEYAQEPEEPTKDGYVFGGWHKDAELQEPFNFATEEVIGDLTLYAKWTEEVVSNYTVGFRTDGGTGIDDQTVRENGLVSRPANPVKEHYTFEGWYTNSSFQGDPYNFSTPVTSNFTLYAKWSIEQFTVTFVTSVGTVNPVQVNYNSAVQEPAVPASEDYAFEAWYTDSSYANLYNFDTPVTGDVTLYAKWVQQFTVTFVTNSSSTVAPQKVKFGSAAARPDPAPVKDGYILAGWYTDSSLDDVYRYEFTEAVTQAITLYAKWTLNSYTVTFISNGSTVDSQVVAPGGTAAMPRSPVWNGYTFEGWYLDPADEQAFDFATAVTGDLVLQAKWSMSPWEYVSDPFYLNPYGEYNYFSYFELALDQQGTLYTGYLETPYSYVKTFTGGMWENVGDLTPDSIGNYTHIDFTLGPDGTPYIAYYTGDPWDPEDMQWVYIAAYDKASNTWTSEPIYNKFMPSSYGSIAVDSQNTPYLVLSDYPYDDFMTVHKKVGGVSVKLTDGEPFGKSDYNTIPNIVIGPGDIPYVLYVPEGAQTVNVLKYGGSGWETVGSPIQATERILYADFAFDPGNNRFYAAYVDGSNIYLKFFNEFSGEWESVGTPIQSRIDWLVSGIDLAIDNAGVPYIAYHDGTRGDRATVVKYTGTWNYVGNPGLSNGKINGVNLAIDPATNDVYIIYVEATDQRSLVVKKFSS